MTIKDIAEKCGVSVSTVSRVMNNQPYVKQDVRDRVLKVIADENFVPHEGAASLARASEDAVGVVVRGLRNPFFNDMINVIIKKLHDVGYNSYVEQIMAAEDELTAAVSLAKSKNVKGIIFLGGRFDRDAADYKRLNIPFVFCTFTNSFGNLPQNTYSSVCIDDISEAKKAVDYLVSKGHKKIGIVLPSVDDKSISQLRFEGYRKALEKSGIDFSADYIIETHSYSLEDTYKTVKKYLGKKNECTAFFAISDTMAMAVMKAINESDKSVPQHYAVIGIDGIELSNYTIPTLTTIVQPREEMAIKSVEIIKQMIEGEDVFLHETMDTVVRKGESV